MTEKNSFDKFSDLMDKNIKGVEYGVYAVAGLGFFLAMRSVRPFMKFRKPLDIPKHFIEKRMKFSGKVMDIKGGKYPILLVDHHPVIALPNSESGKLPIQVSGVDITPNGGIWLGSLLPGSDIDFIPLRADESVVHSIAYRGKQDIGQHLVSIGFGTVSCLDFDLEKDPIYSKYYKALLTAEKRAESKGAGLWQDQTNNFTNKLVNSLRNFRYSIV